MFGLGFQEVVIILVVALLIFGSAKLPQIGSSLGKAIRDFKKGITEEESEVLPNQKSNTSKDSQDDEKHTDEKR